MDSKERFIATINREEVDRHAHWLGLPVPGAVKGLENYFQSASLTELKEKIDDDIWPVEVPYNNAPHYDIGCALDFNTAHQGGSQVDRVLSEKGFFEQLTDPATVNTFNWPDPADYIDKEESMKRVKAIPKDRVRMAFMWSAHFQDASAAFGMEQAMLVSMLYPDMYQAVIDRVIEHHLRANEIFYEATKGELDAITIGNDFGTQTGLMVSPEILRQFIFPGTKKLIDQAKSYGLKVMHHSCGSIFPVIGDIFDLGADIVHPIQALAHEMEPWRIKEAYGDKGAFCGGVDAQDLLVNGTPELVKAKVEELKEIFPTGLILAASHEAILPDVPPANLEAIFTS